MIKTQKIYLIVFLLMLSSRSLVFMPRAADEQSKTKCSDNLYFSMKDTRVLKGGHFPIKTPNILNSVCNDMPYSCCDDDKIKSVNRFISDAISQYHAQISIQLVLLEIINRQLTDIKAAIDKGFDSDSTNCLSPEAKIYAKENKNKLKFLVTKLIDDLLFKKYRSSFSNSKVCNLCNPFYNDALSILNSDKEVKNRMFTPDSMVDLFYRLKADNEIELLTTEIITICMPYICANKPQTHLRVKSVKELASTNQENTKFEECKRQAANNQHPKQCNNEMYDDLRLDVSIQKITAVKDPKSLIFVAEVKNENKEAFKTMKNYITDHLSAFE